MKAPLAAARHACCLKLALAHFVSLGPAAFLIFPLSFLFCYPVALIQQILS